MDTVPEKAQGREPVVEQGQKPQTKKNNTKLPGRNETGDKSAKPKASPKGLRVNGGTKGRGRGKGKE
eukprot:7206639-Prorocentrum_lima.AAC.1